MQKRFFLRWTFAALLAMSTPAWAWNDTGHRLVEAIAWADLTPEARAKCTEILKQHPRYTEDLLADLSADAAEADRPLYAFGMAAVWPDTVRSLANPMHGAYNHPAWHYIDIPYCINGQPANLPPDTGDGPHNILEALAANVAIVKDPSAAMKDQAIALCWVLHLCGDVHQPLHAVEMFSPQFPDGDQGGNTELFLRDPPYPDSRIKLHALWDQLPGQYKSAATLRDLAAGLRANPSYSRAALKDFLNSKDSAAWAKESYDLAVRYAYMNGELHGAAATRPSTSQPMSAQPEIPALPAGYVGRSEQIAMQRIILAGYRTADLLNSMN